MNVSCRRWYGLVIFLLAGFFAAISFFGALDRRTTYTRNKANKALEQVEAIQEAMP